MPTTAYLIQLPPLSNEQLEILTGSLLGDGSLTTTGPPPKNYILQKTQSRKDARGVDKRGYLDWHLKTMEPYSCGTIRETTSYHRVINYKDRSPSNVRTKKPTYFGYSFKTHCHPAFTEFAKKWYLRDANGAFVRHNRRRIKIIPNDIKLSPLSLCIWHMDDGYACAEDANILLNTQGFTWDECKFLSTRLKDDLDINSKVRKKDGKQIIYVGRKSYFDFINMIRPYVQWKCFQYKLDIDTYSKLPHRGESHSGSKLTEDKVKKIFELSETRTQKDIARLMQLTTGAVSLILSGDRWGHLNMPKRVVQRRPRIVEEKKKQVFELVQQDLSQSEIARKLEISQPSVGRILKSRAK